MTLRRRTFLLIVATTWGVLLLSLALNDALVGAAMRQQLDSALLAHARTEAASAFDRPGGAPHIHERPVAPSKMSGALTKYAVIYDLRSGAVLARTQTLDPPPPLDPLARAGGARGEEVFTFLEVPAEAGPRRLRGVWVPAPEPAQPRALLLMAVPDEMIGQVRLLRRSVALLVAVVGLGVAFSVARLLARRLTRGTDAIAQVARAVAAGDLSRRVDTRLPDQEIAGLSRDLNDMIEQLGRLLQAQRRFTSDAAHELRSPITALRGQLEVVLRRQRGAEEYRACLESCLEDVVRLCALTEDLLALSRLEGRPERCPDPVDLRDVAQRTLSRLAPTAGGVSLVLVPGPAAPMTGDALQLERLLRNLVENAVRASPAGGAVEVAVEPRPAAAHGVEAAAAVPARPGDGGGSPGFAGRGGRSPGGASPDRVVMQVLDRGGGIPAALRDRLFEPFMRVDQGRARSQGGTGLGLAIAREIARVHGGTLTYQDRPGGGAMFIADLRVS